MAEQPLQKVIDVEMPTPLGVFQLHLFEEKIEGGPAKEHLALVMGDVREKIGVLTRIHSECCTGDVFGCQRCDCQDQLHEALRMIRRNSEGVLLYLRQEGRGIGLTNKLHAYSLQDKGMDTAEANEQLGFAVDARTYGIAATMLNELGVKSVRLLTNNTNKVQGLNDAGIGVDERIPIVIHSAIRDRLSLFRTKQQKLGHIFDDLGQQGIIDTGLTNERLPLSHPSLFAADVSLPEETLDLCEEIKQATTQKFGSNINAVLFQGSYMRGEGSPYEHDLDFVLIFHEEVDGTLTGIAELRQQFPKCNFHFLTSGEYKSYPDSARLEFFISRKVQGDFDLGYPPSRSALFQIALSHAVEINTVIRPLLLEFLDENVDQKQLVERAHDCLKMMDENFLRITTLLRTSKYPMNRLQLLSLATTDTTAEIVDVLNRWYSGTVTVNEVREALKTAEKTLHEFLTQSP